MANKILTESQILEQVVMSDQPGMSPESAHAILNLGFDQAAKSRMDELAVKNRQGALTQFERKEMENYLRVGNFINLMQAKARLLLQRGF